MLLELENASVIADCTFRAMRRGELRILNYSNLYKKIKTVTISVMIAVKNPAKNSRSVRQLPSCHVFHKYS